MLGQRAARTGVPAEASHDLSMTLAPTVESHDAQGLLDGMRRRVQTNPRHLLEPGPDAAQRRQLFEAAASAPDHGQIRPWRFVLVGAEARPRLAEAFEQALLERDPAAGAAERERARDKASRAPFLALAIVRERGDGQEAIRPHERMVSLGCALQNLLLLAHAQGFGAGLVSGLALGSVALRACFGLGAHESAVCFVAVGTPARRRQPRERPLPERFVSELPPQPRRA